MKSSAQVVGKLGAEESTEYLDGARKTAGDKGSSVNGRFLRFERSVLIFRLSAHNNDSPLGNGAAESVGRGDGELVLSRAQIGRQGVAEPNFSVQIRGPVDVL